VPDDRTDRPKYNVYRSGSGADDEPPKPSEGAEGPPERPADGAGDRPKPPAGRPDYKVYRSRPPLIERLRPSAPGRGPLDQLRRRRKAPTEPVPPGAPTPGRRRLRRFLKWAAIAVGSWILLSLVVFMISAQTAPGVSSDAEDALSGGGTLLTGSNVLVLGSDQRPKGSREPGATTAGPSRSDSILLLHVGVGSVRKLSILRDSYAQIPGHGTGRINAAYAIGGAALTIRTVEGFLGHGLEINHVILVSFTNFPKLIDALGGVDVTLDHCVRSNSFGGKRVKLKKGEHHLTGKAALRFARVRENRCQPNEDDRARAKRQQQVLGSMRSKLVSPLNWPSTFVRGPLIAWEAPRALRTDLKGPGLAMLFTDLLTGGSGSTNVVKPSGVNSDGSLRVEPAERERAVRRLLGN
jgi:LCP family protein required for cell wall assembly